MVRTTSTLLLLGAVAQEALGQFVPPPTGFTSKTGYAGVPIRYKQVPTGICELDPKVKSYSGYADVADEQHIFFWFFEARGVDPTKAPLTVWVDGGPGASSMIGLFQQIGPCGVDPSGNVYSNPYSWSNASNMLFIDQPTQVGFSYSVPVPMYLSGTDYVELPGNVCPDYTGGACFTGSYPNLTDTANSTATAAPNFWKTLQGFMGAFPQYTKNGFHLATESYGGHWGPIFAEYIEQQNDKNIYGATKIDLQTLTIGNGWYDPVVHYQAGYNFTVSPGNTYDLAPYNQTVKDLLYNSIWGKGNCVDQLNYCKQTGNNALCRRADDFCIAQVETVYDLFTGRDEYDIRELAPDPFPYQFFVEYLNQPSVQAAIGAYVNFTEGAIPVEISFDNTGDDGREVGDLEAIKYLLGRGITVATYAGDADFNCNWLGGEVTAAEVNADGWSKAGYTNISTSDSIVHGQVKQAGKYSFSRIYQSGHEVAFYQPLTTFELFKRAISGKDIATGKTAVKSGYSTSGPSKSTYREGISTVQFDVTPADAKYDTTTNEPGGSWVTKRMMKMRRNRVRLGRAD